MNSRIMWISAVALSLCAGLILAGCEKKPRATPNKASSAEVMPSKAPAEQVKSPAKHEEHQATPVKAPAEAAKAPAKPVEHQAAPAKPAEKVAPAAISQKTCPVSGKPIDPKVFVTYQGKKVYFCCKDCIPKFEKEPAKYMAILEKK
jgi:YHS domain-containing protein